MAAFCACIVFIFSYLYAARFFRHLILALWAAEG